MRRITRTLSVLAGVALLASTLAACDEKELDLGEATPTQEAPASPEPTEEPTQQPVEPEEPVVEEVEDPADSTYEGEGEDPATMEDTNPDVDHGRRYLIMRPCPVTAPTTFRFQTLSTA